VLELPDVAELVDDEVFVERRALQENEMAGCVPAEAPEPGDAEQPRRDDDTNTAQVDRLRIELEPIQPCLRAFEQFGPGLRHRRASTPSAPK
jgi:hypothetical protein